MNKLIVYWQLKTMSANVSKKGTLARSRKYKVENRRSEFPEALTPDIAIESIYEKWGRKPEDQGRGIPYEHSFAEIVSWTYADTDKPKTEESPVGKQTEMFNPIEIERNEKKPF